MNRVTYCPGSGGADIGKAFYGLRFAPSNECIGVDFGGQPLKVVGKDGRIHDELKAPDLLAGVVQHHFITHTHLDHTSGLPMWRKMHLAAYGKEPETTFYMNRIALETAERLLWVPSVRMADLHGDPRPFGYEDIEGVKRHVRVVEAGEMLDFEHFRAVPFKAGHVPGALYWIFIPKNGADPVFVSGDFSSRNLEMVGPMDPIPDEIDGISLRKFSLVVMESTYLGRTIPPRDVEKARSRAFAKKVLGRNGTLIVPTFAIGPRGPAMAKDYRDNGIYPLYFDGALKDAMRLYEDLGVMPHFDERSFVRGVRHTEALMFGRDFMGKPKVIFATSGMMMEGTRSWKYAANSLSRPQDGIALIGFQGPDTPGANLAASKKGDRVEGFGDEPIRRECDVERFQLSLHADGPEIEALLERLNPDTVVFDHGEPENIDAYIASNPRGFPWRMVRAIAGVEVGV